MSTDGVEVPASNAPLDGPPLDDSRTFTDARGVQYEGEFEGGRLRKGKVTCPNGDVYEGEFKNGLLCDENGKITHSNGDVYQGNVLNGEPHGNGEYRYNTGEVHSGLYADGKGQGEGRYTYPDNNYYVGPFVNDQEHGEGALYKADGTELQRGTWVEGVFQDPEGEGGGGSGGDTSSDSDSDLDKEVMPLTQEEEEDGEDDEEMDLVKVPGVTGTYLMIGDDLIRVDGESLYYNANGLVVYRAPRCPSKAATGKIEYRDRIEEALKVHAMTTRYEDTGTVSPEDELEWKKLADAGVGFAKEVLESIVAEIKVTASKSGLDHQTRRTQDAPWVSCKRIAVTGVDWYEKAFEEATGRVRLRNGESVILRQPTGRSKGSIPSSCPKGLLCRPKWSAAHSPITRMMVSGFFCAPLAFWRLVELVGLVTPETTAYDLELRERMENPNDPWANISRNGLTFPHFSNDLVRRLKLGLTLDKPIKWYPHMQQDANQMKRFAPWVLGETEAPAPEATVFFVVSGGHAVLVITGLFGFTTPTVVDPASEEPIALADYYAGGRLRELTVKQTKRVVLPSVPIATAGAAKRGRSAEEGPNAGEAKPGVKRAR